MNDFELAGRRILEVGCGLALASLVVHRRGGDVTGSDCHPLVPRFLEENLRSNGLPAMKYQAARWGHANAGVGRFDMIIGSDVLYDRGQPEALSQFIDRHAAPAIEVLIVDPNRGNQPSFSRKMALLGFSHGAVRVTVLPDGGVFKGQIHRYRRG